MRLTHRRAVAIVIVLALAPPLILAYEGAVLLSLVDREILSFRPYAVYEVVPDTPPGDSVEILEEMEQFMYYARVEDKYFSRLFMGKDASFTSVYWDAMIVYGRVEGFGPVLVILLPNLVTASNIITMGGDPVGLGVERGTLTMMRDPPSDTVNITFETLDGGNVTLVVHAARGPSGLWDFINETLGWDMDVRFYSGNGMVAILAVNAYALPGEESYELAKAVRSLRPAKYVLVVAFDSERPERAEKATRFALSGALHQFAEYVRGRLEGSYGQENVEYKLLWEGELRDELVKAAMLYLAMIPASPLAAAAAVIIGRKARRRGVEPGRRERAAAVLVLAVALAVFAYWWVSLGIVPVWPSIIVTMSAVIAVGFGLLVPAGRVGEGRGRHPPQVGPGKGRAMDGSSPSPPAPTLSWAFGGVM